MNKLVALAVLMILIKVASGQEPALNKNIISAAGAGAVVTPNITDYQALGINPANLAYPSRNKVSVGMLELSYLFNSDALTREELQDLVWNPSDSLNFFQKDQLSDHFTNKGFGFDLDLNLIGASVSIPKFGGIGISGYGNADFHSRLNDFVANLIFNGFNFSDYFDTVVVDQLGDSIGICTDPSKISELFNGTEISFTAYSGISTGIGANIFTSGSINLMAGVGVKRLWGSGIVDITVEEGDFNGFIALPEGPSFQFADPVLPELDSSSSIEAAGKGWGFDLGLALILNNKLNVSLAVVDLGAIQYDKNVYQLEDFILDSLTFSGINQYNYLEEIDRLLTNNEVLRYSRLEEKKFNLPSKLRFGLTYKLNKIVQLGFDIVAPINEAPGNLASTKFGAGADFTFFDMAAISTGFSWGGNYGFSIPFGVSIALGKDFTYQAGFASRDMLSYFSTEDPILSGNFAFLKALF